MANPFEGTISGKNTGHTNADNLKFAVIPRSTTQVREIITAQDLTLSGTGTRYYNSDGVLYVADSNSDWINGVLTGLTNFDMNGSFTAIGGFYHRANDQNITKVKYARSSDGWARCHVGLDSAGDAIYRPEVEIDVGANFLARTTISPYSNLQSNRFITLAGKQSAGSAQSGDYLYGSTSPPSGTLTDLGGVPTSMVTGYADRISFEIASSTGFQYWLFYDAALSDADIEAIIENPGAVLSYGGGQVPRTSSRSRFMRSI